MNRYARELPALNPLEQPQALPQLQQIASQLPRRFNRVWSTTVTLSTWLNLEITVRQSLGIMALPEPNSSNGTPALAQAARLSG